MCAIFGWQCAPSRAPDAATLQRMGSLLRHRGPDGEGAWRDDAAGLAFGHRRLAIIDVSAANSQPMRDEATGIVLTYNGELYNFRELRSVLQSAGHAFRTTGDTEVVLRAFAQWGVACFERMNGMFAAGVWDPRDATLHLVRDAMGIKPLYFHQTDSGVVFASELKAFRVLDGFRARADSLALQEYMEFGYVFDERRTMLQGVQKLEPGHRVEVRGGVIVRNIRWFTPPAADPADPRQEAERVEELAFTMNQTVSQHLIADVPLGLLLSGGLDSSIIAALAARESPLLTVCMGFDQSKVDERANARQVSDFIGSRHIELQITAAEVEREVTSGAWVFDDLFSDWATVTTRLLYRRCREQGVKVVLVGEGADELFGGYDVFKLPSRLSPWQQFRLYQSYAGRRWGRLFPRFRRALNEYVDASGGDAFGAVRLFESRRQLPNQYVMKVDKASMAESVEARAPYLDRRVAELAYRTPRSWLQRNGENKYLLRAFARRHKLLPRQASSRPKFGAPLAASWMDDNEGFRRFAREELLKSSSLADRLGLRRAMQSYYDDGRSGYPFPASLSIFRNVAWRLLLLELWAKHYLEPGA